MMFNPTNLGEGFVSIEAIETWLDWYHDQNFREIDDRVIHAKYSDELPTRVAARDAILDIASDLAAEAEGWNEPVNETPEGREYVWHGPVVRPSTTLVYLIGGETHVLCSPEVDRVVWVDERMPHDRVYEQHARSTHEDIDRLIGDSPVGHVNDGVVSPNMEQAILARLGPGLRLVAPIPPIADADAVT